MLFTLLESGAQSKESEVFAILPLSKTEKNKK
jgi:hypothetical protein